MPEQPEPIDLSIDAGEALQRCANYDENLVNRVIAEMQRDRLAQLLQEERGHKGIEVPAPITEQEEPAA